MRELRLVGPGDDGSTVVLETVDGVEQFRLTVDERLRAASRSDRPHLGRLDIAADATLAPRDIQMRVRSGESPDEVAEGSGMPIDRVMRFAYPVLQERSRVTDEARRARARRSGDAPTVPFGELIDARLERHGVEPADVRWDSFRRDDGAWTVTAEFTAQARPFRVKFSFALPNRTISALDDVAADLLSDRPVRVLLDPAALTADLTPPAEDDEPAQGAAPRRLVAVGDPSSTGVSPRPRAHTRPLPLELDDELFDQESDGLEPEPARRPPVTAETGTAWLEQELPLDLGMLPASDVPAGQLASADLDHSVSSPATADSAFSTDAALPTDADFPFTEEPIATGDDPSETVELVERAGRRARRDDKPRMPSWDDILLGVRRKSE